MIFLCLFDLQFVLNTFFALMWVNSLGFYYRSLGWHKCGFIRLVINGLMLGDKLIPETGDTGLELEISLMKIVKLLI